MHMSAYAPVQRIVGVLLMVLSLGFVPPLIFALANQDGAAMAFVASLLFVSAAGYLLYLPVRKATRDLRISDGFLVVVACWGAVCLAGAIPFVLALNASLADAVFESTSGITTTGPRCFPDLATCRSRSAGIASNCSGWAGWGLSSWRSPFCPCCGSVVCRSTRPKPPGQSRKAA
jgi:Trk-type K+ transport system membrane component